MLLWGAGDGALALQDDGARVVVAEVDVLVEGEEVVAVHLSGESDGLYADVLWRRRVLLLAVYVIHRCIVPGRLLCLLYLCADKLVCDANGATVPRTLDEAADGEERHCDRRGG